MTEKISAHERSYRIKNGLTQREKKQLLRYTATDPEIQKNTSDWRAAGGKPGRFSSEAALDAWLAEDRTVYFLADEQNKLAGIIWFGHKIIDREKYPISVAEQQQYQKTLGIRLYGEARGQKLAKPFITEAIERYLTDTRQHSLPLWLEVHTDNARALHVYETIGFRQVATSPERGQYLLLAELSDKL